MHRLRLQIRPAGQSAVPLHVTIVPGAISSSFLHPAASSSAANSTLVVARMTSP
jgi:hypothetical protein